MYIVYLPFHRYTLTVNMIKPVKFVFFYGKMKPERSLLSHVSTKRPDLGQPVPTPHEEQHCDPERPCMSQYVTITLIIPKNICLQNHMWVNMPIHGCLEVETDCSRVTTPPSCSWRCGHAFRGGDVGSHCVRPFIPEEAGWTIHTRSERKVRRTTKSH